MVVGGVAVGGGGWRSYGGNTLAMRLERTYDGKEHGQYDDLRAGRVVARGRGLGQHATPRRVSSEQTGGPMHIVRSRVKCGRVARGSGTTASAQTSPQSQGLRVERMRRL